MASADAVAPVDNKAYIVEDFKLATELTELGTSNGETGERALLELCDPLVDLPRDPARFEGRTGLVVFQWKMNDGSKSYEYTMVRLADLDPQAYEQAYMQLVHGHLQGRPPRSDAGLLCCSKCTTEHTNEPGDMVLCPTCNQWAMPRCLGYVYMIKGYKTVTLPEGYHPDVMRSFDVLRMEKVPVANVADWDSMENFMCPMCPRIGVEYAANKAIDLTV